MTVVLKRQHVAGLVAAAAGAAVLCISAPEALAQFGGLFGEPPRPPQNVPRQQQQRPPQAQQQGFPFPFPFGQPQQQQPRQERIQPGPPPAARAAPPPRNIESEPLPPPGQAGPAAKPARVPAQPANTAPQPGDEVVSQPAAQKIPNGQAVFSGLDKITGRIINFDVALGETVQFGALQVVPRVCYTRPPTEAAATDAFVEVSEVTLQGEVRRIFAGWMFAASPGLNAVEHPIYDVWLTDCKQPTVKVAEDPGPGANVGADQQPAAAPAAPAAQRQQPAAAPAPRPQQQAQQPQAPRSQAQPQRPRPPAQQSGGNPFPTPIR